nr:MAG TPA: hypothetical protein [Caudoviricetes sp.]
MTWSIVRIRFHAASPQPIRPKRRYVCRGKWWSGAELEAQGEAQGRWR